MGADEPDQVDARPSPWSNRVALAIIAAALAATLVRNRVWATPNLGFFTAIADHLGDNPFPAGFDGDYLLTNVTGPLMARLLSATEPHHYVQLHLLALITGIGLVLAASWRRWGATMAAVLAITIAAAPAMTTTLQWLGQPDAFTLPLALGLAVVKRRSSAIAIAIVLGCTHAEQGLVIAAMAGVARMVVDLEHAPSLRRWLTDAPALIGGVLVGGGGVRLWLLITDVEIRASRASFLELGPRGFWDHHLQGGAWLPVALWGVLWIPLAAISWRLLRSRTDDTLEVRARWTWLLGAAAAALLPIAVTLDETRVYAMTTAPLLPAAVVVGMLGVPVAGRGVRPLALAAALVLVSVIPGFFTAGERYGSWSLPPGEFFEFLQDGRHPGELTPWLLGPFGFEVPVADR